MDGKPGQDFLADFAAIGIEPGCSSAELKAAWRRRVSDLHPDRGGRDAAPAGALAREELADINGAYRRLRRFQRLHGRMPGTAAQPHPLPPPCPEPDDDRHAMHPHRARRRAWLPVILHLALLCVLATLVWLLLERAGVRDHDAPVRRAWQLPGPVHDPSGGHGGLHRAPLRNNTTSTV